MEKEFQKLKKIQKVEAPPFLFTRIEQKVKNLDSDHIPFRWVLSTSLSLCILLILNINLLSTSIQATNTSNNDLELILEDMQLNTSNQLYYE